MREPLTASEERALERELLAVTRTASSASDPVLRDTAKKRKTELRKRLGLDSQRSDASVKFDVALTRATEVDARLDASGSPAYQKGYRAGYDGTPERANPYEHRTEEAEEWSRGHQIGERVRRTGKETTGGTRSRNW